MRKVAIPINVSVAITLLLSCVIIHLHVVAGELTGNKTHARVKENAKEFRRLLKGAEASSDNLLVLEHGQLLWTKYFE
ncbi:MAG: hypothetical protein JWQ40_2257 [Segetibacter sp.]|nr:hypothetical protein [Segetibacter sp.]